MEGRRTQGVQPPLSVPSARILVLVPNAPQIIDQHGHDCGPAQGNVLQRDWRDLREKLITLDFRNKAKIAEWLRSAGYVPKPELDMPALARRIVGHKSLEEARKAAGGAGCDVFAWSDARVSEGLVARLKAMRDAIGWLMQLTNEKFRKAVNTAFEILDYERNVRGVALQKTYEADPQTIGPKRTLTSKPLPAIRKPSVALIEDLTAPAHLSPSALENCLMGVGRGESLMARFHWDRDGKPLVGVSVNTPLQAIVLSVHIDKNFSARRVTQCPCGAEFEAKRGADIYCPGGTCKNRFTTRARRKKVKFVEQGYKEWQELPPVKRKTLDRANWIAAWATRKGKIAVDPPWVKNWLASV
jgi:hypothetical protein